jgi:2-polyprenyl-6-methoxyphenol hydroxylase-like FAD-dependent oxidoreductase
MPMNLMVSGIGGSLNLRHPDACQALLDAAASAGATIVRGVSQVGVTAGSSPSMEYAVDATSAELRPSLVIGADGRRSVIRRVFGIALERQRETSFIAGLLVDGLGGVPDDHDVLIGEGDRFFLLFHQGGDRARAYVCTGLSGQHRFRRTRRYGPLLGGVRRVELPMERAGRRGDTGRSMLDVSRRRHLVFRAVRGRRRVDR